MTVDWHHEITDQLDWHWRVQVRRRLEGMTDAEYLWEPVPGCWSLRPRAEARTPMAAGAGDVVADYEYPEPVPNPVTTIAWRMGHVAIWPRWPCSVTSTRAEAIRRARHRTSRRGGRHAPPQRVRHRPGTG